MKIHFPKIVAIALLVVTASAQALQPEVLYAFQAEGSTAANGANPQTGLTLGSVGHFYGTTSSGGPGGGGTAFRLIISAFTSVARQPEGSVLLTGTGPANEA